LEIGQDGEHKTEYEGLLQLIRHSLPDQRVRSEGISIAEAMTIFPTLERVALSPTLGDDGERALAEYAQRDKTFGERLFKRVEEGGARLFIGSYEQKGGFITRMRFYQRSLLIPALAVDAARAMPFFQRAVMDRRITPNEEMLFLLGSIELAGDGSASQIRLRGAILALYPRIDTTADRILCMRYLVLRKAGMSEEDKAYVGRLLFELLDAVPADTVSSVCYILKDFYGAAELLPKLEAHDVKNWTKPKQFNLRGFVLEQKDRLNQ
jgi:hypothetical protein